MSIIDDRIETLKKIQRELPALAIDALIEDVEIVLDMVFDEQLFTQGITGDNIPIVRFAPYSPGTILNKQRKGQPTDRVTLRDEGDFHDSGQLNRVNDLEVLIGSGDPKSELLQDRYGKEIVSITNDNLSEIREFYVKPFLLEKINSLL